LTGVPLLTNRNFVRLWIGQAASFVGDALSMVALIILVAQLAGSASAVGGALVFRLLPTLASPFFGVLADRMDRRVILVAGDLVRALLALGLVFARDLAVIYAIVFLMGAARALFNPTVRAAFPGVVGGGDLTRANSIISGTFSVSITVGPALGGLVVATVGVNAAFVLDAATFLFSAALLAGLPLPRPESEADEGFFSELRAGLGYLVGARLPLAVVVGAFLTVLATDLAAPAEVFLAKQTFDAGDAGYGLLVACWGAGMIGGSALPGIFGERMSLLPLYFFGLFAWGLALVGTGASPTFALALGALVVAGVANGVDNVATDTILQTTVPDGLLGRVFSVRFAGYSAAEGLAYMLGGFVVDAAGARSAFLLAGFAAIGSGVMVLLLLVPVLLNRSGSGGDSNLNELGD
jgi:MFS family permease